MIKQDRDNKGRRATSAPALPISEADQRAEIGWIRGIVSGVIITVVGFAGAVLAPNLLLTSGLSLSRDTRVLLATALTVVVVLLLSWVLRRAQNRGLI